MRAPFIIYGICFIVFGVYEVLGKYTPYYWAKSISEDILSEKGKKKIRGAKIIELVLGILAILVGLFSLMNGLLYPSKIIWFF